MGVYEPLKRKLLDVFPDHLSSVAHLVRLGTSADVSFHFLKAVVCNYLVCIGFNEVHVRLFVFVSLLWECGE